MKRSPAVWIRRIDVCASVEEDLRRRPFLSKRRRRMSTDLYHVNITDRHCRMQWSRAVRIRLFDVCAFVEEHLRRRPFLSRRRRRKSTDLYGFNVSSPYCFMQWRHSYIIRLLGVYALIQQILRAKVSNTGNQVDASIPSRILLFHHQLPYEVGFVC